MYAQNSILCQFGNLEICRNFANPYLTQFSSISGGNCIMKFITQGKTSYIQSNVMISLSLMISYIKHHQYSAKRKYFGPFYYIQTDPQDYDEWHTHLLRKKYTFRHLPSLDLLPHHDPLYPQRHLNHTSPLPTSRMGLREMQVPIPSSRMKGTTTPSFATSRQLPRHKD